MAYALLGRVLAATLLAAVLGWDREHRRRPAGLRTHMLVGLSASLFVAVAQGYVGVPLPPHWAVDPLRVTQAVATGVSFLGAGTVFISREHRVEGLTTAASLLTASGIGVAAGLGQFVLAIGATLIAALVLVGAYTFEVRAEPQPDSDAPRSYRHDAKRGEPPR